MKKRFLALTVCFVMMIMTLSGCGLIRLNVKKYLDETIATVNGVNIRKEELIKSLNNYYATYINQYGMSEDDAFQKCLDNTINKEVMLQEAKKYELAGKITFNQFQKNELWRDTFEALNANLQTFEKEIKKELGIVDVETGENEEEKSERKYIPFEPKAKIEYNSETGKYVIVKTEKDEDEPVETEELSANDFVVDSESSENVKKEAMRRYIKNLKKNEKGKELSEVDSEVWSREVERIYKNYKESEYITKLLEYHQVEYAPTVDEVLSEYVRKVKKSYEKYAEDSSLFVKDLSSDATSVYYVPSEEEQYFYVAHILIGYSEKALADMNLLKKQLLENTISQSVYDDEIDKIKRNLVAVEYDEEGKLVESSKTVSEVIDDLNREMLSANESEKADIFNKFMFKYSTDNASLSAKSPYTVGVKTSTMMEDFTAKSRELHKNGVVNGYTDDISKIAYAERWSEENVIDYGGYHIISYLGNVKNLFEITDINTFRLSNPDIYTLSNARINPLTNKTYFDLIYDELTNDRTFTIFENIFVENLVKNATIVTFSKAWKDLK